MDDLDANLETQLDGGAAQQPNTGDDASANSVDAAIEAAFAAHEGQDGAQSAAERARDELGRFTAQEQARQAADAAKQAAPEQPQTPAPATGEAAAPAAWGKAREALFKSLPPEAQSYIAERERQISEGFKRFEGLSEYADLAAQNGGSLRDVLGTVKQLEDLVASDPVQGFAVLMQRAGFDPADVARAFLGDGKAPAGQAPSAVPPQVQQTLQSLQREVQELRSAPIKSQIEQFANDPANKHFERVAGLMASLIQSDASLSLKDAYDRACYADPQVRAELLQEQRTAAAKEQADKLAKAAQTAQRASRGLSGSAPTATPLNGKARAMSIEESIEAALAAHT